MSEYESSRTMPALPEHVFDQVDDVERLGRWLPGDLHLAPAGPSAVTVHEDRTGADQRARFRVDRDRLRLEWGTRDSDHYAGWLQVTDEGSGSSRVTIRLTFFDEGDDPGPDAVRTALGESLERLEEQVRLRVEGTG
ncbi:SRPBCC family protein [Streptomyces mashuensis]|nr:SRPBCC family protein [Streptomyces mashuensis]